VFPRIRSRFIEGLDLARRSVEALEGILKHFLGTKDDPDVDSPLIVAVDSLTRSMKVLASVQQDHAPSVDRLEALELGRVRWESECEGLLLKAEGKHNAAKAAEMRARSLNRAYEKHVADPFVEEGVEQELETVRDLDAQGSEAQRLPALHVDVAPPNKKAVAIAAKWGT